MTNTQVPTDAGATLPSIDRRVVEAQSAWKAEARALGKLAAALGPLAKGKAYQDLSKLPQLLEKVEARIRTLPVAERGAALLEEVRSDLQERRRRMHQNLAKDLQEACKASQLELRVVRREEPIEIRIPPFAVLIDRNRGRAELRFARQPVANCAASAEAILRTRAQTLEALRKGFDAERFFDDCLVAWRAACGAGCAGAGDRVELLDFLPFLVVQLQPSAFRVEPNEQNFRGYSRARFAYDVQRLRKEVGLSRESWRMNLGVATGTTATKKNRAIFFEDEQGDGEFKLTVFFNRGEVSK